MSIKRNQIANQNVSNSAIPLPDPPDPQKWVCIQMTIPDSLGHRAAFLGAISNLATWRVWQRDMGHGASVVANLWKTARQSVRFVECSIPPHMGVLVEVPNTMSDLVQVVCIDGKCILQYRCDVCSPWQTVANVSDLQTNPSGAGNQPAPGGGTSSDCVTIYANQTYAIPVPVNTGDKIEIISSTGKWSDQFARWLCIDGNLFFINCTGVGGASGSAGDPLLSANHLSAIVQFSTGYFPLYPGASLIVPAGIVNEQPTILANKPTVNSGDGWIDICWKVTNNSASHWCFDINFASTPGGFVNANTTSTSGDAVWTPGVGWTAPAGSIDNETYIKRVVALPAGTLVEFDWVGTAFPDDTENISVLSGASHVLNTTAHVGASGTLSGTTSGTGDTVYLDANAGNISMGAAPVNITHARFSGPGTNPFGSSNC